MLLPLKVEGIIHDFKVVASVEKNRPKIVIYLKVESSVNLKIWSCHLISEPACQFLDNVKEYS
jgi:ribosomal protein S8